MVDLFTRIRYTQRYRSRGRHRRLPGV